MVGLLEVQRRQLAPVQPLRRARPRGPGRSGRTGSAAACRAAKVGPAPSRPRIPRTSESIDSGWTITSICSGGRSNSQRASITSRALFISVAESTVIFGPIRQVGCAGRRSAVTSSRSAGGLAAERPAAGRRARRGATSLAGGPPRIAWKMALCSLSTGRSVAPRSARQLHDQRPGDDERFLVRQGDRLAGLKAAQVPSRPAAPTIAETTTSVSGSAPSSGQPVRPNEQFGHR